MARCCRYSAPCSQTGASGDFLFNRLVNSLSACYVTYTIKSPSCSRTPFMTPIRILPGADERVETGAIRFGDDWPGTFVRGDNACYTAFNLASIAERVAAKTTDPEVLLLCQLAVGHAGTLVRCDLQGMPTETVQRAADAVARIAKATSELHGLPGGGAPDGTGHHPPTQNN
jgi:hypothetical protein